MTFNQLKDAAASVFLIFDIFNLLTSLSELFSNELKFTIDTLVKWFNDVSKSKFGELTEIQKQIFTKENPIDWLKTNCSICEFMLSTSIKEGHQKT